MVDALGGVPLPEGGQLAQLLVVYWPRAGWRPHGWAGGEEALLQLEGYGVEA